jgi:hypothetical protein
VEKTGALERAAGCGVARSVSLFVQGLRPRGSRSSQALIPRQAFFAAGAVVLVLIGRHWFGDKSLCEPDEKPDPSIQLAFTAGSGGRRGHGLGRSADC